MIKTIFICTLFLIENLLCQIYDPDIENLMNQVNLDSLTNYTRVLSGEDSVIIDGTTTIITDRINSSIGNDSAFKYIKNKINNFGYFTNEQIYSETGKNLYVIKEGLLYPDKYFILCAHYDAVAQHCADDNASGVAGVLEAARVFSKSEFNYSVVFAFWDEEEVGLFGSKHFAQHADSTSMDVIGVLNFEMSGYDSDNDGLIDIHTRPINQSIELAKTMYAIDSVYNIPLEPIIYNPGTTAGDHSSFWTYDFSAIVFSEAYYGGDFNPYYHSRFDRIVHFNLPYFYNVVKLSVGTTATLANEGLITSVKDENAPIEYILINNYPNPFNNSTKIVYTLPNNSNLRIDLYDSIGQKIKTVLNDYQPSGKHSIDLKLDDNSSGVYFVVLKTDRNINTHKILLMK